MNYKVRFMMDDSYEVVELTPNEKYDLNDFDSDELEFNEQSVYQGSLANCEAYIRLHEGGYM
jgi:hypothetical protein